MPQRSAIRRPEGYGERGSSSEEQPSLRRQIVAGIAVAFLASILAASVLANQLLFEPRNVWLLLLVVVVGLPLGLLSYALTRACHVSVRFGVFGAAGVAGGGVVSAVALSGAVSPLFVLIGAVAGVCAGGWATAVARYRHRLRMALAMVAFAGFGPLVMSQFV